jgi:hypothetical protein
MKNLAFAIGLVGVWVSPLALAQSQIVGFMPSSETKVSLYDTPAEGPVVGSHQLGAAPWPLDVLETRAGFVRVAIGGKDYWVKTAQVRMSRGSSAGCTTARLAPTTQTSSTPGVGKIGC